MMIEGDEDATRFSPLMPRRYAAAAARRYIRYAAIYSC